MALARNRVTAGKAEIIARQITILIALQIDLEVLTEWGTMLVPGCLEFNRLRLRHNLLHSLNFMGLGALRRMRRSGKLSGEEMPNMIVRNNALRDIYYSLERSIPNG
jgi:hypothetical protein